MVGDNNFHDIRACVFDAYGTLFDFNAPLAARQARIGPAADRLSAVWRQKQIDYTWLRSLMGKYADFWQVTGEALDYAMAACDVDDPALRAELMQLYLALDAFPDARPCLEALKGRRMRTAVLSNGTVTMLTAAVNANTLTPLLDRVMSVDPCGVFKPHPSVYQLAVDELDAQPAQICFVSANGWDVAGAAAFGFRSVWINRAGAPVETLPFQPVAEIRGLDELADLLPS